MTLSEDAAAVTALLLEHLPPVLRWTGEIQRLLRPLPIALGGKSSGHAATDALTIADVTSQSLILSCLRDASPRFRACQLFAEERSELTRYFAPRAPLILGLDPLDGTQGYRDGNTADYAIILTLRDQRTVLCSLLFLPEEGPAGSWLVVHGGAVYFGPDDVERAATAVVRDLPRLTPTPSRPHRIFLSSFAGQRPDHRERVRALGYEPIGGGDRCLWLKMALGDAVGAILDTPNVYDFPAGLHVARALGGDALWSKTREPVHFRDLWYDEPGSAYRLPGIVACAIDPKVTADLAALSADWEPTRYNS